MDPYVAAALTLTWAVTVLVIVALFAGSHRLTTDDFPIFGEDES